MPQSELFVYVLWVSLLSGKMREWTLLETPKGVYSYAVEHLYQTNKKRAVVELGSKLHAKLDRSVLRNKIVRFSLLSLDGGTLTFEICHKSQARYLRMLRASRRHTFYFQITLVRERLKGK